MAWNIQVQGGSHWEGDRDKAKKDPSALDFVLCSVEDVGGFSRWGSADWGFRQMVWEAMRREEALD